LREIVIPRLAKGADRRGRKLDDLSLMVGPLTMTGPDAAAVAERREHTRQLLTFLYSTPSYWPSLELFGWRERGEKLHALTREGKWGEMAGVIDDEMVETFAPAGTYDEIADKLRDWYAGLSDWITFPMPEDPAQDPQAAEVIAALRA
jgi:alkanesulfonate monooxygenase SsuD/methylene tetrahydromethanopterin reductase-like flavin-dependent oxidoreductase (luciferase family)